MKSKVVQNNNVNLIHVSQETELIKSINSQLPDILIVDQSNSEPLTNIANKHLNQINKIVITTNHNGSTAPPQSTVPVLRLKDLVYFIKTIQSAKRIGYETHLTSESLYKILIENVNDFIFFKDVNSRYIMINKSFANHYQKEIGDILGKTDSDLLFSQEIIKSSQKTDHHILTKKRSITFETSYIHNNKRIYLETVKTPVTSKDNDVVGIVGISRDITTKRHQEELVRRNALLLNQSEQLTNSGSFEIKHSDKLQTSDHLKQMLEIDTNDNISIKQLYQCIYITDRPIFTEAIQNIYLVKKKIDLHHRILTRKSNKIIPCHTILNIDYSNGNEPIVFGTILNINEARKNQQAILDAQENERKSLAANLHDSLIQKLVASNMYLTALEEGKFDQSKLSIAKELITSSIEETRRLTRNLSLRNIENFGLKNALLEIIESYPLEAEIQYQLDFDEHSLNLELSTHIYRIFQEAIANIMKYAFAKTIKLSLSTHKNVLTFQIEDNGVGFVLNKLVNGNGIKNMRQRVTQCNGIFQIKSQLQEGTSIEIKLPIN